MTDKTTYFEGTSSSTQGSGTTFSWDASKGGLQ